MFQPLQFSSNIQRYISIRYIKRTKTQEKCRDIVRFGSKRTKTQEKCQDIVRFRSKRTKTQEKCRDIVRFGSKRTKTREKCRDIVRYQQLRTISIITLSHFILNFITLHQFSYRFISCTFWMCTTP